MISLAVKNLLSSTSMAKPVITSLLAGRFKPDYQLQSSQFKLFLDEFLFKHQEIQESPLPC
jgi:hypothetical protein